MTPPHATDRLTSLASTALALKVAAPALLHSIRGSLHDATMLAALLQPGATGTPPDAAKSAQRLRLIGDQIQLLERDVALLAGFIEGPRRDAGAVCASSGALAHVLRLLKDEAARRRLRFEYDVDALPPHVCASEHAFQQAMLACGAWLAQHAGERATMSVRGCDEAGEAVLDFDAAGATPAADSENGEDLALLAALVDAAGGRLATTPRLRVAFPRADRGAATPA